MFRFTSIPLADAVIDAAHAGVAVRILLDTQQAGGTEGRQYPRLHAAGISVQVEHLAGRMHHAFAVVDGTTLVTGSYNWASDTADFDNVLFMDCAEVAATYTNEFNRIWTLLGNVPSAEPPGQDVFVRHVQLTSPATAGEIASVSVETLAGAECTIRLRYKTGYSTAAGLYAKQADAGGHVAWEWLVGSHTTPGTYTIFITARKAGEIAKLELPFVVQE